MEVAGRIKVFDDEAVGKFCKICGDNDFRVQAFGYCQNCKVNLCRKCLDTHKKDQRSSFHETEKIGITNANDPLPVCQVHENEVIKLYCRTHGDLGCNLCMLKHKDCETDYIPHVSTQFTEFEEYLNIETCLHELRKGISEGIDKMKENRTRYEKAFKVITASFREVKTKIIDRLNAFEQELEEEVDVYRKTNEDKMAKVKFDIDALEAEMSNTTSLMDNLRKENKCNLQFIETKNAQRKISNFFERIYEISTRNFIENVKFYPSSKLFDIFTSGNVLGAIKLETSVMEPCNSSEILETDKQWYTNIKSESDKKTCYATGLVMLSADQLAIADKANKNVKVVDVSHDQIISQINLSSSPRDITLIPPNQLAVTLRDEECIQLLSTRKGLTETNKIKTSGNCRGIKYDDGKLIVAYDSNISPKIEIIRLNGEVLCTFQRNETGSMIFIEPKCIGLSPDRNRMYITDLSKMFIFRLSMLGNVTNTFGRHRYMGLAVSSGGTVYACSKSSNSVFQLPDDLSEDETVLTINDGIKAPIALAISNVKKMLYVSCGSNDPGISNKLHGFKFKARTNENTSLDEGAPSN